MFANALSKEPNANSYTIIRTVPFENNKAFPNEKIPRLSQVVSEKNEGS